MLENPIKIKKNVLTHLTADNTLTYKCLKLKNSSVKFIVNNLSNKSVLLQVFSLTKTKPSFLSIISDDSNFLIKSLSVSKITINILNLQRQK